MFDSQRCHEYSLLMMPFPCVCTSDRLSDCCCQKPPSNITLSDLISSTLLSVNLQSASVIGVDGVYVKSVAPLVTQEQLCQLLSCCEKLAHEIKEVDPCFKAKIVNKAHTSYHGPLKVKDIILDLDNCMIDLQGLDLDSGNPTTCG